MTIYPALLSDSREELQKQIDLVKEIDAIETVQVDVIDGKFADNLTITPADLPDLDWGELQIDLHLMTDEPLDYVYELIDVKDQLPIRAVIGQIEHMSNQAHFLEDIEKNGWMPGVSLDLYTPIDELDAQTLRFIKVIQIMGIEAGFQGKEFNPLVLEKIAQIAVPAKQLGIEIIVDGGINLKTISSVAKSGAQAVAVGSTLWKSNDISETIDTLLAAAS